MQTISLQTEDLAFKLQFSTTYMKTILALLLKKYIVYNII